MASIWNDIEIEWAGEVYTVRPTFEFINHLERKDGRSISKMYQRAFNKDLPSGAACEIIADTINWAGRSDRNHATVTPEDIYAATSGGMDTTAATLASTILIALMPSPKDDGPVVETKKKPTQRKRTGGKSTA